MHTVSFDLRVEPISKHKWCTFLLLSFTGAGKLNEPKVPEEEYRRQSVECRHLPAGSSSRQATNRRPPPRRQLTGVPVVTKTGCLFLAGTAAKTPENTSGEKTWRHVSLQTQPPWRLPKTVHIPASLPKTHPNPPQKPDPSRPIMETSDSLQSGPPISQRRTSSRTPRTTRDKTGWERVGNREPPDRKRDG